MTRIEHNSVNGIQFEQNKKVGYYTLNKEVYYNKFHALLEASKQPNITQHDPVRWSFNEDVFIRYPWHIEPEPSLKDLYFIRAKQIRDRYDYVRIEASGGSDSSTAIFSFLLNGLHVDEIVFRYPKQGEKNMSNDPHDTRCENTLSEWEFAAKPLFQWISTNYPNVKITFHDYSDNMSRIENSMDESWFFQNRHYLQPGQLHKFNHFGTLEHQRLAEKDLSIGVIYGIDKPKITVKDGKFFLFFTDIVTGQNNGVVNGHNNITNEFFYWTPDLPELICKQSHLIMHWFNLPQNLRFRPLVNWPAGDFARRTVYENIVESIIYPDYDLNTFQTVKSTNNIYNEMDAWFHENYKNTRLYNVWQAGIEYLVDHLDSKYVWDRNGRPTNIKDYQSPFYYLGDAIAEPVSTVLPTKDITTNARTNDGEKFVHCINNRLSIY